MDQPVGNYRQLDSLKIIETVRTLHGRIEKRFPGSGLSNVVAELFQMAEETVMRTRWIQKPHLALRCVALLLSIAILVLLIMMLVHIRQFHFDDYTNFIQAL